MVWARQFKKKVDVPDEAQQAKALLPAVWQNHFTAKPLLGLLIKSYSLICKIVTNSYNGQTLLQKCTFGDFTSQVGLLSSSLTYQDLNMENLDVHISAKSFLVKPSISTHSKPRTRLLKCFVLQHNVIKTKHLRSLIRGVIRVFEWVEILGYSFNSCAFLTDIFKFLCCHLFL